MTFSYKSTMYTHHTHTHTLSCWSPIPSRLPLYFYVFYFKIKILWCLRKKDSVVKVLATQVSGLEFISQESKYMAHGCNQAPKANIGHPKSKPYSETHCIREFFI